MGFWGHLVHFPGDVEPAVRRIGIGRQHLAIDGVDGDALAGSDDADNAVTGQRVAASGVMQGHAGDQTLDGNGAVFIFALLFAGLGQGNDLVISAFCLNAREHRLDHFAAGIDTGADIGTKFFNATDVENLENSFEGFVGILIAFFFKGPVQDGLAQFQVLFAFLTAHEPADTGPRLAGHHEAFPGG